MNLKRCVTTYGNRSATFFTPSGVVTVMGSTVMAAGETPPPTGQRSLENTRERECRALKSQVFAVSSHETVVAKRRLRRQQRRRNCRWSRLWHAVITVPGRGFRWWRCGCGVRLGHRWRRPAGGADTSPWPPGCGLPAGRGTHDQLQRRRSHSSATTNAPPAD